MNNEIPLSKFRDIFQVIRRGTYQQFMQIINSSNVNTQNDNGQSLLHYSIAYEKKDITMELLNKNININLQDKNGSTVLHYICDYPDLEIAKLLIEKGVDINARDKYGNSAIWYAVGNCKGRNYDLVELIMKYNPDIHLKNNVGKSPLDSAVQDGDEKLIRMLQNEF